jgi:hypothetical protein
MYVLEGTPVAERTGNGWECIQSFLELETVDGRLGFGDMIHMGRMTALPLVLESGLRIKGYEGAQDTLRHRQIGWEKRGSAVGRGWVQNGDKNRKDQFHYQAIHW